MSEVKTYAKLINKNIKINGYGYVKSQSIKKDEVIKDDTEIEVTLE